MGESLGGRLYRVNLWANSAGWVGRGCGPLEWAELCEKARLEPLAYLQAYREFWSANWQLRRIDCILSWAGTAASHALITFPKIIGKRVKHAKTPRLSNDEFPPPSASSHPCSLRRSTQPHRGPLFFPESDHVGRKEEKPPQLVLLTSQKDA